MLGKVARIHMKTIQDLESKVSYEIPRMLFLLFDKSYETNSCAKYLKYMDLKNQISFSNGDKYIMYLIKEALRKDEEINEYLNKIQMMMELAK
jgi:hypothetical protein